MSWLQRFLDRLFPPVPEDELEDLRRRACPLGLDMGRALQLIHRCEVAERERDILRNELNDVLEEFGEVVSTRPDPRTTEPWRRCSADLPRYIRSLESAAYMKPAARPALEDVNHA